HPLLSFPTRRSSDLNVVIQRRLRGWRNIQNQLLVHVSYNSIQLGIFLHPMARLMTKKTVTSQTPLTYRDAGVDIDTGEALVQRIKPLVERSEERRVGKECRSKSDWSSDVCSSDLG